MVVLRLATFGCAHSAKIYYIPLSFLAQFSATTSPLTGIRPTLAVRTHRTNIFDALNLVKYRKTTTMIFACMVVVTVAVATFQRHVSQYDSMYGSSGVARPLAARCGRCILPPFRCRSYRHPVQVNQTY